MRVVQWASFGFGVDDPVELLGLGLARVHLIIKYDPKFGCSGRKLHRQAVAEMTLRVQDWLPRPS